MFKSREEEIFDQILVERGLVSMRERKLFLSPDYSLLHDPRGLPDMPKAVERISEAKKRNELIYVYGDYDVDGLSATALLLDAFNSFGLRVKSYIPSRFTEGYGMSMAGVKVIADDGAKLIVTVDCGSRSVDEINYASELGLDVIVTDHHAVGDILPSARAVINPKRHDSEYPFNDLAGVGVAFKLVKAIQKRLKGLPEGQEKWLLDLVALGTTCDVVSLTDENRVMTYWGVEVSRKGRRPAFEALSRVSGVRVEDIDTTTFGFQFGPRLNAAGRLETAQTGLDLLTSTDISGAGQSASILDTLNTKRRAMQEKIFNEASAQAMTSRDDVLVLADKDWSHGVVGIVASQIVEKFRKPAFIIQIIDEKSKGSARSFGDFNLAKAVQAVSKHTIKSGGHSMAAGVTLRTSKIDSFRTAINEYYRHQKLGDQFQHVHIREDFFLDNFDGVNQKLVSLLTKLEPYGKDNEKPVFKINAKVVDYRLVGNNKKHLKLTLADRNGVALEAIGFGLADQLPSATRKIEIFFTVGINTFRDETKVQLNLIEITSRK